MIGLWIGLAVIGLSCKDRSDRPQVVLYCSVDQEVAEPIIAGFEKQSGIRVLAQVRHRGQQDRRSGAAAPGRGGGPGGGRVLVGRGLSHDPTGPRRTADAVPCYSCGGTRHATDWPATFADPNGCWYGFALRGRVIGYNTNRVPAAEAPKSLEDVLAAKWKGRLVMASPAFGTTGGDVASWFAHYGPDRARQILRGLKDNEVRLVSGNSTAVRMVATGQADICFTDTDDIYAGQRNGWPVAMNFLDQGGDGVLAIPNTAALVKGGPNPENAEILMRFLLSEALERRLVESDSHNSPLHAEVAGEYPQYAIPHPLRVDYGRVADFLPEAIQAAREILE